MASSPWPTLLAAESWLLLHSYIFGSVDAMRSLGRCVMASFCARQSPTCDLLNYFIEKPTSRICLDRGPKLSKRHVFTLTGVQGREGKATSRSSPVAPRADSLQLPGGALLPRWALSSTTFFYDWSCITVKTRGRGSRACVGRSSREDRAPCANNGGRPRGARGSRRRAAPWMPAETPAWPRRASGE